MLFACLSPLHFWQCISKQHTTLMSDTHYHNLTKEKTKRKQNTWLPSNTYSLIFKTKCFPNAVNLYPLYLPKGFVHQHLRSLISLVLITSISVWLEKRAVMWIDHFKISFFWCVSKSYKNDRSANYGNRRLWVHACLFL